MNLEVTDLSQEVQVHQGQVELHIMADLPQADLELETL